MSGKREYMITLYWPELTVVADFQVLLKLCQETEGKFEQEERRKAEEVKNCGRAMSLEKRSVKWKEKNFKMGLVMCVVLAQRGKIAPETAKMWARKQGWFGKGWFSSLDLNEAARSLMAGFWLQAHAFTSDLSLPFETTDSTSAYLMVAKASHFALSSARAGLMMEASWLSIFQTKQMTVFQLADTEIPHRRSSSPSLEDLW